MSHPQTITVFGATGFVGRHLIGRLAKTGATIHVPTRDAGKALLLKPMGDIAQIVPIRCSTRSDASVAAAIGKSDAVINLIGILYEKGRNSFQSVHVETAARIARLAREEGATSYVHMSALGLEGSRSTYARTKIAGEQAVKTFFPNASIIRPSVIFGPEDKLFNKFATMSRYAPALPLIGGGHTKFQPVYVGDVAEAIAKAMMTPQAAGQVYELAGPQIYTFRQLLEMTMATVGRPRCLVNLPWPIASLQASLLQLLPKPPLTVDQVKSLRTDNILRGAARALHDLGITPTALEMILPTYLR